MSYFTITIDTEADNAWSSPDKIEMKNFQEIPRFQKLCERYKIVPIYLLTYEYATYQPAIEYLRSKLQDGLCEIGYHLHAWTTPPFQNERNGVDIDWLQAYQFELPDSLFEQKANHLHETIINSFGVVPVIHRAGRWGIDNRTIDWLSKNKYLIDTSIIPYYDLSSNKGKNFGGKNFSKFTQEPFLWETENTSNILELPVTVSVKNVGIKKITNLLHTELNENRYFNKVINKIHQVKMLRPNPSYSLDFYSKLLKRKGDSSFINMMLHSSELAYKCSPFTRSNNDYHKIWRIIECVFIQVVKLGMNTASSQDIYNYYSNKVVKTDITI